MRRIDEIRERLDKATPGLAKIDGGEEILKRRGNPKGVYTWTLYGPYADAILLVNAPADLAWLLGEVERLSAERMQPEQADPTDAEIWAAARAVFETRDDPYDDTEWDPQMRDNETLPRVRASPTMLRPSHGNDERSDQ